MARRKGPDLILVIIGTIASGLLGSWIAWRQAMKLIEVQRAEGLVAEASPGPSAFLIRNRGIEQHRVLFAELKPQFGHLEKAPVRYESDVRIHFTQADFDQATWTYRKAISDVAIDPGDQALLCVTAGDGSEKTEIVAGALTLYYGAPPHVRTLTFPPSWIEHRPK